VAVRSLKSGYGEFLQDAALTNDEISQLEASFSNDSRSCLVTTLGLV